MHPLHPKMNNQASDQAISDKQAALDSLLSVNYDEQHPVAGVSANNAPTRAIPHDLGAQQPGVPGNLPQSNPTQRISDPSVQRRIRRDSRPDAGGTQVFKKR